MIEEDYVSFEIAKLLKEKGFDEECSCFYENILEDCTPGLEVDGQLYYMNSYLDDEEYAAPTLQMAMKWLREVHNLIILVEVEKVKYNNIRYNWTIIDDNGSYSVSVRDNCQKYEWACEAAIKYSLKKLI